MLLEVLIKFAFLSSIIGFASGDGGESHWDYWTEKGPENWHKYYPKCNGMRQSPININTAMVKHDSSLGNILFTNYGTVPRGVNFTAKNKGRTVSVSFEGYSSTTVPFLSSGGLPGTFKLISYHFHWGMNSIRGSEHQKDGVRYPAELHLVHMNMKYPNLSVAVEESDGLAVLGVFIKEGQRNEVFENFLNLTKYNVTNIDMKSKVTPFKLMSILPTNKTFYRYNGSLTTPKCQESVTWTVFDNAIEISKPQLDEFRKLKYLDSNNVSKPLVDTFRPVQSLNGRMVLANFILLKTTRATGTTDAPGTNNNIGITMTTVTNANIKTTVTSFTSTPDSGHGISENLVLMLSSVLFVFLNLLEL